MNRGKKSKTSSLQKRFGKLITLSIVLLAVVSILTGAISSYRGLLKNVDKDLSSIVQIADGDISGKISSLCSNANREVQDAVTNQAQITLQDLSRASSSLKTNGTDNSGAALVSADGTVQESTSDTLKSVKFTQDTAFKQALQGKTLLGSTISTGDGSVFLPVYVPVNNQQDIVVFQLPGTALSEIVKDFRVGDTGNVFLLDSQGVMVANMRAELVNQRANFITDAKTDSSKQEAANVYSQMIAGKSSVSSYAYSGVERVCSYRPVTDGNGWSVGAVAPISEMTSSIGGTVLMMTVFILLCAVLCEIVTMKVVVKITKPITDCAGRLTQLSEGDLHTPVPTTDATDETGILLTQLRVTMEHLQNVVRDIDSYLGAIAQGNLSMKDPPVYPGDFASVSKSISTILASLNHVMQEIEQSSSEVTGGSEQIAAGAQALSQGATEQASSVQELAATIQEISKQVADNTRHAGRAEDKATETAQELEQGKAHMQDMVHAMQQISDASNKINEIIKSIQTIAFQTNILALNAAVEAARAGEAGKGFAVVADEVRNLANKSQEAAQNTTQIIGHSVEMITAGMKIADETAASMDRIVEASEVSNRMVHKISQASKQQDTAIQQVTNGMDQISSVVQTNSATSEESAAASEELSGQAEMLKKLVSFFKLRQTQEAAASETGSSLSAGTGAAAPAARSAEPCDNAADKYENY